MVNTSNINKVKSYDGSFAHLNVVLTNLKYDKEFIFIGKKAIGCYPNNSNFDHKVNFSDVYVKEFFSLFRYYLQDAISKETHTELEKKMLKEYYPKLVLKSRLGLIKKDKNIKKNFELIFSKNPYFFKKKKLFTENNIKSNILLILHILKILK